MHSRTWLQGLLKDITPEHCTSNDRNLISVTFFVKKKRISEVIYHCSDSVSSLHTHKKKMHFTFWTLVTKYELLFLTSNPQLRYMQTVCGNSPMWNYIKTQALFCTNLWTEMMSWHKPWPQMQWISNEICCKISHLQGIRWLIAEQFVSIVTSSLVAEG